MKKFLSITFLALSLSFISIDVMSITDEDIAEITKRLEGYSTDELVDRRDFLLAALDIEDTDDSEAESEKEMKKTEEELEVDESRAFIRGDDWQPSTQERCTVQRVY